MTVMTHIVHYVSAPELSWRALFAIYDRDVAKNAWQPPKLRYRSLDRSHTAKRMTRKPGKWNNWTPFLGSIVLGVKLPTWTRNRSGAVYPNRNCGNSHKLYNGPETWPRSAEEPIEIWIWCTCSLRSMHNMSGWLRGLEGIHRMFDCRARHLWRRICHAAEAGSITCFFFVLDSF